MKIDDLTVNKNCKIDKYSKKKYINTTYFPVNLKSKGYEIKAPRYFEVQKSFFPDLQGRKNSPFLQITWSFS